MRPGQLEDTNELISYILTSFTKKAFGNCEEWRSLTWFRVKKVPAGNYTFYVQLIGDSELKLSVKVKGETMVPAIAQERVPR
jgi:hypothetical protein